MQKTYRPVRPRILHVFIAAWRLWGLALGSVQRVTSTTLGTKKLVCAPLVADRTPRQISRICLEIYLILHSVTTGRQVCGWQDVKRGTSKWDHPDRRPSRVVIRVRGEKLDGAGPSNCCWRPQRPNSTCEASTKLGLLESAFDGFLGGRW